MAGPKRWRQHSIYGDPRQLTELRNSFRDGYRLCTILGPPGIGKTALGQAYVAAEEHYFPDGVTYARPILDDVPGLPRATPGRHLLVIDDAEVLNDAATRKIDSYLKSVPTAYVLLTSRRALDFKFRHRFELELAGLSRRQVSKLMRDVLGNVSERMVDELWGFTAGHPLPVMTAIRLVDEKQVSWDQLFAHLQNFAYEGVLGPDGFPARDGRIRETLITDVGTVNAELVERASRDPELVYLLPPRAFEELVAELLVRQGYAVELTPPSKDGGFDMYAARRDGLGEFLFLVECKRYSPHRKVGVHVVRALQGVLAVERATGAALVTTSYFTRGAQEYQSQFQHELKLHDYVALRKWLEIGRRVRAG